MKAISLDNLKTFYTKIKENFSPIKHRHSASEIDGLTTGGNIASVEVVDNLISTDTDKALSANQGRILNDTMIKVDDNEDDFEFELSEPIIKYVHTSNKEIQPLSLDLETGIFTFDNVHNLTVGQVYDVISVFNYDGAIKKTPYELKDMLYTHKIHIKSENTFTVSSNNVEILSYDISRTPNLDVSAFRFELPTDIKIEGFELPLNGFTTVATGMRFRPGWGIYRVRTKEGFTFDRGAGAGGIDGRQWQIMTFKQYFEINGNFLNWNVKSASLAINGGRDGFNSPSIYNGVTPQILPNETLTVTSYENSAMSNGSTIEIYSNVR